MASTVGTTTSSSAQSFGRNTFFAVGRYWVFYYVGDTGTYWSYRSSVDGITWSDVAATGFSNYNHLGVWFDGTYVHLCATFGGTGGVLAYRRGLLNSNGTITWNDAVYILTSTTCYHGNVCVDSAGYPWVTYQTGYGSSWGIYAKKSSTKDGTFSVATTQTLQDGLNANFYCQPIPLTNQRILFAWMNTVYGGTPIYLRTWNGSSLNALVTGSTNVAVSNTPPSTCPVGDDAHVVFQDTSGNVKYQYFDYSDNALGGETTIVATLTKNVLPVICKKSDTLLYCFWRNIDTDHMYYSKYQNSAWSSATDWIDESTDDFPTTFTQNCFYKVNYRRIGMAYITKTGSPYNIRFDFLKIKSPTPVAIREGYKD